MPTAWETFPIKFEGGLITSMGRLDQGLQAPGSATILQNYEVSVEGGYKKVLGYEKFSDTVVPSTGDIVGVWAIDATKCLCLRNGVYRRSTGGAWTTVTTMPETNSIKARGDTYNFNGTKKTIIVDGVNDPFVFSHVANTGTIDTGAPAEVVGASFVRVFKNHIFFGKGPTLSFTAPYTDTDYTPGNGAGTINIGSEITDMIVFREQLIIFSVDKIHRLTGNALADFVLQPIANDTGCLRPDTAQEVGGDILYLGPDGVRFLSATEKNDDFGLERASANIQSEVTRLINNPTAAFQSLVVRGKNQYRLFSYVAATTKKFAEGLIATKFSDQSASNVAWSKTAGFKVYTADSKQFDDDEVILFSSDDSYIYRMEVGNSFDGVDISAIFRTPDLPISDPRIRKTIYKHSLYLSVSGTISITVGLKLDYENAGIIQPATFEVTNTAGGGGIWGSGVWGSMILSTPSELLCINQTVGSGFTVALKYEDNSSNSTHKLDHAVLEYAHNERR